MTDDKDSAETPKDGPAGPDQAMAPAGASADDAEESGLDLGDMEPFDGADPVADGDMEDFDARPGRASRRNPYVSAVVVVLSTLVMAWMWPDVRFFLRSRTPEDLGRVQDVFVDGEFTRNLDNRYVVIEGTPDVQHAAKVQTTEGASGYLRLRAAGGSMFAQVPREEERAADRFAGRFEGRIRRLDRTANWEWVQQFFDGERIQQTLDLDTEDLVRAIGEGRQQIQGLDEEGAPSAKISLQEGELLRVVVRTGEVRVQMGRSTWGSAAAARSALEALAVPFVRLDDEEAFAPKDDGDPRAKMRVPLYRTFLVRVPGSLEAANKLVANLNAGAGVEPDRPDPKIGAVALPHSSTYSVDPKTLAAQGDQLSFAYDDNVTSPGYDLVGGKLVERGLDEGRLSVRVADLSAVRVERQIQVDPSGYVVLVGQTPGQYAKWAGMFGLVGLVMVLNLVAIWVRARRRKKA